MFYRNETYSIGSLVVFLWEKHMNLRGLLLVALGKFELGYLLRSHLLHSTVLKQSGYELHYRIIRFIRSLCTWGWGGYHSSGKCKRWHCDLIGPKSLFLFLFIHYHIFFSRSFINGLSHGNSFMKSKPNDSDIVL